MWFVIKDWHILGSSEKWQLWTSLESLSEKLSNKTKFKRTFGFYALNCWLLLTGSQEMKFHKVQMWKSCIELWHGIDIQCCPFDIYHNIQGTLPLNFNIFIFSFNTKVICIYQTRVFVTFGTSDQNVQCTLYIHPVLQAYNPSGLQVATKWSPSGRQVVIKWF